VALNVYNPIIKDPPLGSILLEYADDEVRFSWSLYCMEAFA